MSNKVELKEATGIDTSTLASNTDLVGLKTKVYDLDMDKLKTVSADLSNLSNLVDKDVVKKLCMINWLLKSMLLILIYHVQMD